MREQALLAHIAASTTPHPVALVGPGDDCAVLTTPSQPLLLATTDQLIQGRHFEHGEDLAIVARKAVARSISDIAAMGGTTAWAIATGAIPHGTTQHDAQLLTDALHTAAAAFGCPVVGGDIAATDGPLVLTVAVIGTPHSRRGPVLRSTARPGDHLYVTGALGGSFASRRHLTFTPRLIEAHWLCTLLHTDLRAMMDLSDGVGLDAGRLARASRVAAVIKAASLPCHQDVPNWQHAVSDGEDYELIFAVDPSASVPPRCPETGTTITRIGHLTDLTADPGTPSCTVIDPEGKHLDATAMGWEHRS